MTGLNPSMRLKVKGDTFFFFLIQMAMSIFEITQARSSWKAVRSINGSRS